VRGAKRIEEAAAQRLGLDHLRPGQAEAVAAAPADRDVLAVNLFLAPEQLADDEVRDSVAAAQPSLLVVDEAHCISEWGHDFRPEYLRLGDFAREIGRPTILALTATAAPPVRAEILERLDMPEAQVIVRGFDRPNIWLGVEAFRDEKHKREALLEHAARADPPGIVYVATRRAAEEIAEELAGQGLRIAGYHAGLRGSLRDEVQERFMGGDLDVVVATIAFGMGLDKPDVRWVLHHDVSDSLDSYWQEVGRSGRDGEPARALLHYRQEDLGLRRFFAASYFGEDYEPPCGNCDVCDAGRASGPVAREPFPVGARVAHHQWGAGVVQRYDGDHMVVLFDDVGYKTLGVALVEERGLLEAAG
jgi:ATP-dependent DNA helicase RecQ